MNVLHVIPSLSLAHGGPSVAVLAIEAALSAAKVGISVVTTDDDGRNRRLSVPLGQPIQVQGRTRFYFRKQTEFYKISLPLWRWLRCNIRNYDLVHVHAVFSFTSVVAAYSARKAGLPYVITPHGILNSYGITNRRQKLKLLSLRLIEGPMLRRAAAMHYTSRAEQTDAKAAGATARGFIIPLGLDLMPYETLPDPTGFLKRWPQAHGRKLVLFLARLNAVKGLDLLLPAFAEVRRAIPEVCLVIAGEGEPDFLKECQQIAADAGIAADVIWTGFLDGNDKLAAFAAATTFVLPSYSENFGIAAVEALAAGVPCVLSQGVAVSEDVAATKAGLVVSPEVGQLSNALIRMLSDESLRQQCSRNGRRLVQNRFSLSAMGESLSVAYRQILHESSHDQNL